MMIGIVMLAGAAGATDFHVPSVYGTIQAGLDALMISNTAGDRVVVDDGIYYENLSVGSGYGQPATELISVNGPAVTIIDGSYSGRCIDFQRDNMVLDGFTLQHGGSPWVAGNAFQANQGNIVTQNCVFKRNGLNENGAAWNADPDGFFYGATGGVAYIPNTGLIMTDCEAYENAAWAGQGAVVKQYSGWASIYDRCEIYGNYGSYDGFIKFEAARGEHVFLNTMMTGNWSDGRGGIYVASVNTDAWGTYVPAGLDIIGCTIMDNLNGGYGCAFYNYRSPTKVIDSILLNNTCYGADYSIEGGSNITVTNSNVHYFSGVPVAQRINCIDAAPLVVQRGSGWTGHVGGGNYQSNWSGGVYTPRVKGDYHLTAASPCIDMGTPDAALTIDFDGDTRDDTPDIGYDEVGGDPPPAVAVASCASYAYEGNTLALDGTASTDASTYAWTQTGGKVDNAILTPTAALASIVTPAASGSTELTVAEASLEFTLAVDGGSTDTCACYVRIPGDANGDDVINAFDISRLRQLHPEADFNDDGGVNAFDLAVLRVNSSRRR